MRRWYAILFAVCLIALMSEPTQACSPPVRESVEIHCGATTAVAGGWGKAWDPDAAIGALGDACAAPLDELTAYLLPLQTGSYVKGHIEWFLPGGTTLVWEPWSPSVEQRLRQQRESVRWGDCGGVSYERVGNWSRRIIEARTYCYTLTTTSSCTGFVFSPTIFMLYVLAHPSRETWPYLKYWIIGVLVFGVTQIYLRRRSDVFTCFAFGPVRAVLAGIVAFVPLCVGVFDGVMVAMVLYWALSIVRYGVVRWYEWFVA